MLAEHSEYGYVDQPYRAMTGEPEAVPEEIQQGLTRDAHARRRGEMEHEWRAERAEIISAVERFAARPYAGRFRDDLKAIRAAVDRITRAL